MSTRYVVYGGELADLTTEDPASDKAAFFGAFRDPGAVVLRGVYPTWEAARAEWKAASWQNVDNALMRFFIKPVFDQDLPPGGANAPYCTFPAPVAELAQRLRWSGE